MKKIQRLKKEKSNASQQYSTQDYLLVKKAARFTRGNMDEGREDWTYSEKTRL